MTAHDRYLVRQFNRAFGDIEWQEELTYSEQGLLNLRRLFKDEPARISSRELFATLSRDLDIEEMLYQRPPEMVRK
jgi:hypothetical protein